MAEISRGFPEDVLEYLLFPRIPKHLNGIELTRYLEKCCGIPPHLYGRTNFGDNIDDEWFIVYLLFELSKYFPDLVIKVNDNDGEFLLIEAADVLPKWLTPETAESRVYIFGGNLHVIPIPQTPTEVTQFPLFTPSVEEALDIIYNSSLNTVAPQVVQTTLRRRIDHFPAKIKENTHYTNVYVPVSVAALLKEYPCLVSDAVRAFYYRDPFELKVCRTMNHFKPENMIVTRVQFTRCLYAQLIQQKFQPDKRSGWVLPSTSNPKFTEQDLGMKLAHGLEILCAKHGGSGPTSNGVEVPSDRFAQFLKSLKDKGYFRGEIEGSKLYKQLFDEAKKFYQSQIVVSEKSESRPAREILKFLQGLNHDVGVWKAHEKSLPQPDDDSWLELSPEGLDEILHSAGNHKATTNADVLDLNKVAESMTAFVEKSPILRVQSFQVKDGDDGDIEFDGTGFIHAMQKMFEFKDDEDESSSDMSEYDWEEESDEDLGSPTKMPGTRPASKGCRPGVSQSSKQRKDPEIAAIMQAMDRELARTDLGKSFETEPPRPSPRKFQPKPKKEGKASSRPTEAPPIPPPSAHPQPPPRTKRSAGSASKQSGSSDKLLHTSGRPTQAPPAPPRPSQIAVRGGSAQKDIDDEDDEFRPVNIDLNVVKNTLESYKAQQGLSGPASNILHSMGIRLPPDEGKK
ncbi:hypothetical protein C0Q70_01433 [Pomacea canaliculata]|uniref:Uncharacterized protein n=1 Tax=Pomacea canaliculata TaxID=400727 RepID=A0A2T7PZI6_POMCA|nr:hypothetical protein C0Q70_01433 [Pomacea canaliculata]